MNMINVPATQIIHPCTPTSADILNGKREAPIPNRVAINAKVLPRTPRRHVYR